MGVRQPSEKPNPVEEFAGKVAALADLQGQEFSKAMKALLDQMHQADRKPNGRQVQDRGCFARLINADIREIRRKSPGANSPTSVSLFKWMIGE